MSVVDKGTLVIDPATSLVGELAVPGDGPLALRALVLAAICDGPVELRGMPKSLSILAAREALDLLGARTESFDGGTRVRVIGVGLRGLREPTEALHVGGSRDLACLLAGVLAGQNGTYSIDADDRIARVGLPSADELRRLTVTIDDSDGGFPLSVTGGPVVAAEVAASDAAIKGSLLLASLFAATPVAVHEAEPTHDHLERLLRSAGARVVAGRRRVTVHPVPGLVLPEPIEIPGDPTRATPYIIAGTLLAESRLFLRGVSVSSSRTTLLDVLERMGARIAVFNRSQNAQGEAIADLEVHAAELTATTVEPEEAARMVDELPLLALAASMSHGRMRMRCTEVMEQQSPGLMNGMARALRAIGSRLDVHDDSCVIRGVPTRPEGGRIEADGSPQLAELGVVAGLVSRSGVRITGADGAYMLDPAFVSAIDRLAVRSW